MGFAGAAFLKRAGARAETYTWLEEWLDHQASEGLLAKVAGAGFNLLTVPYWSGFGVAVEAPAMAAAAELASRARRHGMRCLAVCDLGGICLETVPRAHPEVLPWLLREPGGELLRAEQYWRAQLDFTDPDCREWLGLVFEAALDDGFDGLWLHDAEPRRGYQPAATDAWREFITSYTDFYQRKCGYPPDADLAPPPLEAPGDPLWMDWDDFWHHRYASALADFNRRIKQHHRERLLVVSGGFQEHHRWERYRHLVDAVHTVNPWCPGIEHGEVVSQASQYLIADAAGVLNFGDGVRRRGHDLADLPAGRQVELGLAEALFYGGQPLSAPWALLPEGTGAATPLAATFGRLEPWHTALERPDRASTVQRLLRFAQETARLHASGESAATIAILHSRDSLRFDSYTTVLNLRAAQVACLRRHLPADVLNSDDLATLERYDVLVVPEQPCLSQAALGRICTWVRSGGGLVLVGEAAVRARRGRLRPPDTLAVMLGLAGDRWSLPNAEVVMAGAGRVLALPALGVEPYVYTPDSPDPSAGWEWLADAVHDVSAWPLPVTVWAPETLFCRAYRLEDGSLAVMLLNVAAEQPVEDAELVLHLDWPAGVAGATLLAPERPADGVALEVRGDGGEACLKLPRIEVYAVVEVRVVGGGLRRAGSAAEALPEVLTGL
ncbi:MAG: hypothetical protein IT204_24960 [Fimbriimonadaceae bacterium]|nr:hypothetical protein [Fimbriimonadaceae bacterium]